MAEQAGRAEKVEHVDHKKWMENGCWEFYMSKVPRTRTVTCMTRFAPVDVRIPVPSDERQGLSLGLYTTYKSLWSLGPNAGSYNPPEFGRLRSSRRVGFTICLTEMRRISSVVKNEKEMLCAVDGIDWEIFMVSGSGCLSPELGSCTPSGLEAQQLDLCRPRIPNFSTERVDREETRDHVCVGY